MNQAGIRLLSTTIDIDNISVANVDSDRAWIKYSLRFTRDLPQLSSSEDWVECVDYYLLINNTNLFIEDIDAHDSDYYVNNSIVGEVSKQPSGKIDKSNQNKINAKSPFVNRSAIVDYATRYVYVHNKEYVDYSGTDTDCTNFASQALYAGGWQKNYQWTANDVSSTASWSVADQLFDYLLGTGDATYANTVPTSSWSPYKFMRLGDLLFYTYPNDKYTMKHTMIITKIWDNEAYLTYHSNDSFNVPFSVVSSRVKDNTYFFAIDVDAYD